MVGYSADDYLRFSAGKETIYYSEPVYACEDAYVLPTNDNSEQWGVRSDGHWTYVNCLMYSFPPQGWKIHITSTIYDAQNVLYDVAEYLFVKSISFKYLSSRTCFIQANGKYADRLESGKFITIYPSSEHIFIQLLKDLKTIVCKYDDGPYILTDKQWQNSNVFFRYGALKPRFSNEKNVPVIVTPQGDLIPDKELPLYSLPSFVDEPIYVKENNYFIEYCNNNKETFDVFKSNTSKPREKLQLSKEDNYKNKMVIDEIKGKKTGEGSGNGKLSQVTRGLYKYLPFYYNGKIYNINFMRFYIDKDNKVNCIFKQIQFDRTNKENINEDGICYPKTYQNHVNKLDKLIQDNKGKNFCYNPPVAYEAKEAEKAVEAIVEKFVEFVKKCEEYDTK